jgi:hypothetical protein
MSHPLSHFETLYSDHEANSVVSNGSQNKQLQLMLIVVTKTHVCDIKTHLFFMF